MLTDRNYLVELVHKRYKSTKYRAEYEKYIDTLVARGLPPILSFRHLADVLQIAPAILQGMAFATDNYYRAFEIPKRSGGLRKIFAPSESLGGVQRWLSQHILQPGHTHFLPCVVGYVSDRSILSHVTPHTRSECLIKFDLKDFFPSIRVDAIFDIFKELGYSRSVSRTFAALVTMKGILPQGARTSPIFSNIYMRNFDAELLTFCDQRQYFYTRYADDIVISGDSRVLEDLKNIKDKFSSYGLILNHSKTRVYKKASDVRFVTGLSLENGRIRVPKAMRRRIRAQCHLFLDSIEQMISASGAWTAKIPEASWRGKEFVMDPTFADRLLGKLNYWLQIEPENAYASNAKQAILTRLKNI